MIEILPHTASHVKIRFGDFSVEEEFNEFFTFFSPGYKFAPAYKSGMWDGKIRIHNKRSKTLPRGLIQVAQKFADTRNYKLVINASLINTTGETGIREYMDSLNMTRSDGSDLEIREYQYTAVETTLKSKRNIILAATSSGKSMMIYSKIRWHLDRNQKCLLIVPTVNLVDQMIGDFKDYSLKNGWDVDANVHPIYAGKERVFDKGLVISTWQSLAAMQKGDVDNYDLIASLTDVMICDETHRFKSLVVSKVIEGFTNTEWRTGTSGTLDGTQVNELVLIGLLGPVTPIISAREMMDSGYATEVDIRLMLLKHPEEICKALKGMDYKEEVNQLIACPARNRFITNLALATSGNCLVLYDRVASHGKVLHDMVKDRAKEGRSVYFIHGKVDTDERERIRKIVETENNAIILATSSLFSTGTNIPSLENIIFAMPSKSNIRIRQSIGRGIRLKNGKSMCKVFDIADSYKYKKFTNTTYTHMEARIAIYLSEDFKYTVNEIDLKY